MRKIFVFLLVILILSGCSIKSEQQKESPPIVSSEVDSQKDSIDEQKDSEETEGNISNSVYKKGYYEKEAVTIPRVMFLNGSENLKAFPYENADSIKEIKDTYVIVHTVVLNEEGEDWGLVEVTDVVNTNNYGYIKVDRLNEKPYKTLYINNKEAISKVEIGDVIYKAIVQFGNEYDIYKTELGWSYSFNKENGYVVTQIDPISNTVKAIIVNVSGFGTKEGFQVGDNAIKAFEHYKTKYEMNTNQHLFKGRPDSIFDLGDGYVIEFDYEPKELKEESVITRINLYNINDGDW